MEIFGVINFDIQWYWWSALFFDPKSDFSSFKAAKLTQPDKSNQNWVADIENIHQIFYLILISPLNLTPPPRKKEGNWPNTGIGVFRITDFKIQSDLCSEANVGYQIQLWLFQINKNMISLETNKNIGMRVF